MSSGMEETYYEQDWPEKQIIGCGCALFGRGRVEMEQQREEMDNKTLEASESFEN